MGSEGRAGAQQYHQGLSIPVSETGPVFPPAKAGCYQGFLSGSGVSGILVLSWIQHQVFAAKNILYKAINNTYKRKVE